MRYCTLDDLQLAIPRVTLIQLSNDDPLATDIDADVVERAVSQGEELIDAALRGRYQLPVSQDSTVLRELAVNLARHWLYARRPEGGELPDAVVRTHSAALKILESIRTGALSLGLATGASAPEPAKFKVRASRRRFGDDTLDRQPS